MIIKLPLAVIFLSLSHGAELTKDTEEKFTNFRFSADLSDPTEPIERNFRVIKRDSFLRYLVRKLEDNRIVYFSSFFFFMSFIYQQAFE